MTDLELLRKYKKSNKTKYLALLYKRYIELVYGVGLKYFKNSEEAKDLCQDIFLVLHEKLSKYEVDNFKSWLYTLSKNHCLERLRSQSRHSDKENDANFMYYEGLLHPDSEEGEELNIQLKKCLDRLKDMQKLAIDLFYYQKKSYQQMSEELGLSWGQIRSNIQNGRRNLKICLEKNAISI